MKRCFVVDKQDRVLWAICVAAYVLIAEHFSPLSIVRAELDEGSLVDERPFGASPSEDRFITILATLAMYAALDPDSYKVTHLDQIPATVMKMIADIIRDRGEEADDNSVRNERDQLLGITTDVLRKYHMYHLHLAAALMEGPITTSEIEELKEKYYYDLSHVA